MDCSYTLEGFLLTLFSSMNANNSDVVGKYTRTLFFDDIISFVKIPADGNWLFQHLIIMLNVKMIMANTVDMTFTSDWFFSVENLKDLTQRVLLETPFCLVFVV